MPFVAVSGAAARAAHFPITFAVTAESPAAAPAGVGMPAWVTIRAVSQTGRIQQLSPDVLLPKAEWWLRP